MTFHPHTQNGGYLLVLVLVFGAIFFTMIASFTGYVVTLKRVQDAKTADEKALAIAEAGLDYYKWFLAHNPDDTQNGTGAPGPYVMEYRNELDEVIGEYSLEVSSNELCSTVMSIDIESTGYTLAEPDRTRTLYARYARPTVAEYAYIINDNVWAGDDRDIIGPYHSNGYIRMDGTNNSIVSSGQESWECDDSQLICSDSPGVNSGDTIDAVFGEGPNDDLWQLGVPPIDFVGITLDLGAMQNSAQNDGGRYFAQSGARGYHVVLQGNSFRVYRVNSTYNNHIITSESEIAGSPFSIPAGCPLIYFEDKVWLEGTVDTKITLAAARVSNSADPNLILQEDLTYGTADGGVLAVAENDVKIGIDVPDIMEINGIFVAQEGKFGRDNYGGTHRCKDELTINGTIVSNGRVGTKWVGGGTDCMSSTGPYTSGFAERVNSFDRDLVENPPPLTPNVSDTYQFIDWREIEQ